MASPRARRVVVAYSSLEEAALACALGNLIALLACALAYLNYRLFEYYFKPLVGALFCAEALRDTKAALLRGAQAVVALGPLGAARASMPAASRLSLIHI